MRPLVMALNVAARRILMPTGRRMLATRANCDYDAELTLVDSKIDEQRKKSFVNRIKRLGTDIDWSSLVVDKRLNKAQGMVRVMSQIIRCELSLDGHVINSLINHLQSCNYDGNPIYEAHYCILMLLADRENAEKEVRERLLKVASTQSNAFKFPIFSDLLSRLASRSNEEAKFVHKFMRDYPSAYKSSSGLVMAYLQFGLFEYALEHITHMNQLFRANDAAVLFFNHAREVKGSDETKLQLIKYFADRRATLEPNCRSDVEEVLKSLGYSDNGRAVISPDHVCQRCSSKMKVLSDEEFARLSAAVRSKVIIRSGDKYVNTTPEELARFTQFVDGLSAKKIKFDLVVDILNVMNVKNATRYAPDVKTTQSYRTLGSYRDVGQMKKVLLTVLGECLKQFDRIMLSGRTHMKQWHELNKFLDRNINQVSHFYAENNSADDPFMLHLVTQSKRTYIMSNDFFRSEQSHLGPEDGPLLDRLLEYRQIKLTKGLEFIYPENCEIVINVSDKAIHVPLLSDNGCYWICAKKVN